MVGPQPVVGPPCPAPRVVIPTIPNGRCFFHSVVINTNPALQTAVRDSTGFLDHSMLQINEMVQTDASQFMCEHVDEYIGFEGEALHTDMPEKPMFHVSLAERIKLIMATSKVLQISINISNTHHDTVFRNGEDVLPHETSILVQYTPM